MVVELPTARVSTDWMDAAACGEGKTWKGVPVDPEWWFPETGTGAIAKAICKTCPVLCECADYASRHHLAGIWAGRNEVHRYGHRVTHKPRGPEERVQ